MDKIEFSYEMVVDGRIFEGLGHNLVVAGRSSQVVVRTGLTVCLTQKQKIAYLIVFLCKITRCICLTK